MSFFKNKSVSLIRVLQQVGIENTSKDELDVFIENYKEQIGELWQRFITHASVQEEEVAIDNSCDQESEASAKIEVFERTLDNGQVNKPYKAQISLPDPDIEKVNIVAGEDFQELSFDTERGVIQGVPQKEGDAEIVLEYLVKKQVKLKMYINEDPRNLWKDIPSTQDNKPDNECLASNHEGMTVISASRRGRSHGQKGTPRDDHYLTEVSDGWLIAVVADGVGSAGQSNLGSKIASEAIVQHIKQALEVRNDDFLPLIDDAEATSNSPEKVKELLYEVIVKSAHKAFVAMTKTAKERSLSVSDLSTTLSLVIVKQLENGRFVASFQVGDGVIACYTPEKVDLLCKIDRGEYKGQTLALNSKGVFSSREALVERLYFDHVPNDTKLILMTDGIIDPYFDNDDDKLKDVLEWNKLWEEMLGSALSKEKPEEHLLEWLNFYIEAEHDDRTITIIQ